MASTFTARYHGTCQDCLEDIEPGEEIISVPDGFQHVDCQPTREGRAVKTCPECWLTLPCEHTE